MDRLHPAQVDLGSDGGAAVDDLEAGGVDRGERGEASEDVHRAAADRRPDCDSAGIHIERATVEDGRVLREAAGKDPGQPALRDPQPDGRAAG